MFKRKTVLAHSLSEEKSVFDCLNKLIATQTRATEHQLRWAKTEENSLFLCLFSRLAELSWIGNELLKQIQEKQNEINRVFRDIHQEEKIVEETRKALSTCEAKYSKLQKQVENAKKKNDAMKIQGLEVELTTQGSLFEHLTESLNTQAQKLELYKVDLFKKALQSQAEVYLCVSSKYQALFNAQLNLANSLPKASSPVSSPHLTSNIRAVPEEMQLIVSQVSSSLELYPPANGGINVKKLSEASASSPLSSRRSMADLDLRVGRLRGQHSISAPVLVGHNTRTDDSYHSQPPPPPPRPLPREPKRPFHEIGNSGEYCEIDANASNGIEENHSGFQHKKVAPVRRTQSGSPNSSPLMATQRKWKNKHLSSADPFLLHKTSKESILDEEDEDGNDLLINSSSSSSEDLNSEMKRQVPPQSSSQGSEECYADPVDAIHNYYHSTVSGGQSKQSSSDAAESPNSALSPILSFGEDAQHSREIQLQQFHDRLHKDASTADPDSPGVGGGPCGEVDPDPTYSRPFDALMGNTEPLKVTAEKGKRTANGSPTGWQKGTSGKSSPPPLPSRDEKIVAMRKFTRYSRAQSSDCDAGCSRNISSPVQPSGGWERREPVWKRSANRDGSVSPAHPHSIEKPQPPSSVTERLRLLRQRTQSDGPVMDELRPLPRPPMPLPIPEQATVEFKTQVPFRLNGHIPSNIGGGGGGGGEGGIGGGGESRKVAPTEQDGGKRKKAWLERTHSDLSDDKIRSKCTLFSKRNQSSDVAPLPTDENDQKDISKSNAP